MFKLIAAIGKNRELGKGGDLCFHIKEDMQFFKATTMGHAVLMGHKTWLSLGEKPLSGRENYILSRHEIANLPPHAHQITEIEAILSASPSSDDLGAANEPDDVIFIIGGASIYQQFLPYCTELYLTEIDAACPEADVFFPEFDASKYHKTIIKEGVDHGVIYAFAKYTKL